MLILSDFLEARVDARLVEAAEQLHGDDARLVAEHGPAEVRHAVERDEADDAADESEDAGGKQQPHPRPDGPEVRFVDRVEVLQTLDGDLHLDVAHPHVDRSDDDDQQRDDRLDYRVRQMRRPKLVDSPHVQRFLPRTL